MFHTITPRNQARLARRAALPVDPERSIAIKRDVHVFEVGADAARFAKAFQEVMIDPAGIFGLIRVKRPAERLGRPFEVGERFQGCFSLERAALAALEATRLRFARGGLARVLGTRPISAVLGWLEDMMLSDFGEIAELRMTPDLSRGEPYRLRYCYLEGTPIAGSSTFMIEPLGPERCRLTQVFEFQEVNGMALRTFERIGLKMHDQVVAMQVRKAARRTGAPVISGTIPEAYQSLFGLGDRDDACGAAARPTPGGVPEIAVERPLAGARS